MKIGLVVPQFGINVTKENLVPFHIAEKEGFESLWVYDLMVYAINSQQPFSGTSNKREWPKDFKIIFRSINYISIYRSFYDSNVLNLVNDL